MSEKELPKNLPEDIGREKNIVSMSETAGARGDVMSKIGIGLDAHFEGGERRRHPKSHGLLKGLLAYFSAALLVIGILIVVSWRFAEIREASRADLFVETYIAEKDIDGWRQQLRLSLPGFYPEYEDASKLAYDVLSPALELGDITHLSNTNIWKRYLYDILDCISIISFCSESLSAGDSASIIRLQYPFQSDSLDS